MKKDNAKMLVHLNLGENFREKIQDFMEDEFYIACKKWDVKPNTDDKQDIFYHAIRQLRRKVSENARTNWDLSDELTVKINAFKKETIVLELPSPKAVSLKSTIISTRDGWEIDQEMNVDAVELKNFCEYMIERIELWARTAVFYGVGSFAL